MAGAVRRQTIERGRDPRDATLVAFGGAGPMHACEVAAEVGIRHVVVPVFPGHFSAIGMLAVNLRLDRQESFRALLSEIDRAALGSAIRSIGAELSADLNFADGAKLGGTWLTYSLALRYYGQDHTLLIPASDDALAISTDFAERFQRSFEQEYLRRYGHLDSEAPVEVVELAVVAERRIKAPEGIVPELASGDRNVLTSHFALTGEPLDTPVIARGSLRRGEHFSGPIVIYEEGATTVVPPGASGQVGLTGELLIEVAELRASAPPQRSA